MSRPRVVIVGAGFAGYRAARTLARLTRNRADITLLNPTDYFLYLPLLPQVAAGVLEARRVTVSLPGTLRGVRLVLGEADGVDLDERTVHYSDPEGGAGSLRYDRLVLAVGSVNKLLPVPGVAEHAHGFRGLPEALYLRDHVTRQVELAAAENDPGRRAARCTFVVVGAGYTGTEVAAHLQMLTDRLVRRRPPARRPAPPLAPAGRGAAGAAGAGRAAVPYGRPGAAGAGCRRADGHVGEGGHPGRGAAHRRGVRWPPGPWCGAWAYDPIRWWRPSGSRWSAAG